MASALLLSAVLLHAQVLGATVSGRVTDADTGAPLAGAVVELPDLARVAVTDDAGRYELQRVASGPQHLVARSLAYGELTLHALVPGAGTLVIDVALHPAPLALSPIDVRVPLPVRGVERTDSATPGDRVLTIAAIHNHPMLAEPDAFQALVGGEVVVQPESPSGLHLRGGASDHTAYVLDGVPVLSPYHAAGLFSAWNPDALAGVRLTGAAPPPPPPPTHPPALSGTVEAWTRAPGRHLHVEGSVGTAQARVTLDGPLGERGLGYLASVRAGFPGVVVPSDEPSYLHGEMGDALVKLEAAALGGRLRLLGYTSESELGAAAVARSAERGPRHSFEWESRSVGATWTYAGEVIAADVRLWSASAEAASLWLAPEDPVRMASLRRDLGVLARLERKGAAASSAAGLRLERLRTSYRALSPEGEGWQSAERPGIATAFVEHARALGGHGRVWLGVAVSAGAGAVRASPRMSASWSIGRVTLSASAARLHQFAQSVRNPESVVSNVFPAELFVAAGTTTPDGAQAPVARSDQAVLALDVRPLPAVWVSGQAYARSFTDLLLIAPVEGGPFATAGFVNGSGSARGIALEAAPLEWEACQLLDQGCEFGGSPDHTGEPLGGTTLPTYLRVDVGLRKHWHARLAGRDVLIAAFGSVTNVLGAGNVLTYGPDPVTGVRVPLEMRPRAPLVVGMDLRF